MLAGILGYSLQAGRTLGGLDMDMALMDEKRLDTPTTKQLVEQVDRDFEALDTHCSTSSAVASSVVSDVAKSRHRLGEEYGSILKDIALERDAKTDARLSDLHGLITHLHFQLLVDGAKSATRRAERVLKSPLWLGERTAPWAVVQKVHANLRAAEAMERPEGILALGLIMEELTNLESQLAMDEHSARLRLPIHILQWGLPITIGLWVSNRLTRLQNAAALSVVLCLACLAYIAVRFRLSTKATPNRRLSRWLRKLASDALLPKLLFAVTLLSGVTVLVGTFGNDAVVESRLHATIGPVPDSLTRGAILEVPFGVQYNDDVPAVDITVRFDAEGLGNSQTAKFSALNRARGANGKFSLNVSQDTLPGVYVLGLYVTFTADSWFRLPWTNRRGYHSVSRSVRIIVR